MNPRNAKPSVIFVVLFMVAVGTASWLGFRNGNPEQVAQPVQNSEHASAGGKAAAGSTDLSRPMGTSLAAAEPAGQRLFSAPVWGVAQIPEATPESSYASRAVLATATLDIKAMPMLKQFHKGDHVVLPLGQNSSVEGVVNLVVPNDAGWVQVAGSIPGAGKGSFMLSQSVKDPSVFTGRILRDDQHVGYEITTTNGTVKMNKKPLNALVCESLQTAPPEAAAVDGSPVAPGAVAPTGEEAAIPVLSSKPATLGIGVLYLDFDGETVTDPSWNAGVTIFAAPATVGGAAISATQVTDIWKRVSEDFQAFNVTVTTDPTLYAAAPAGQRIHCIITPTSSWYTSTVGGISFTNSYLGPSYVPPFSSTVPCWVFNNTSTAVMALTISHELGHTLGLSHDGTNAGVAYYAGHDTGATSWGPIMGAPYGKSVTQWSKGEYSGANNTEDDIAIIAATVAQAGVVTGFVTDEAGQTTGTAYKLAITSPINQTGIVSQASDQDWYEFKTAGGPINITLTPGAVDPDLDTKLQLYDNSGNLLQTAAVQSTSLKSSLVVPSLSANTYYLVVSGKGRAAVSTSTPPVIGYTSYGSVGPYTLTGTYSPLPAAPMITQQPAATTIAPQGTKVTLSVTVLSNTAVTYQWKKGGVAIPGKTASTLVFTSVQPGDAATYTVDVKNAAIVSPISSDPAGLTVYYKPVISVTPPGQPSPAKSTVNTGANVSYTVIADGKDGPAVLNYQWQKNKVNIGGANAATLNLNAVTFYDSASYACIISNTIGSVTSSSVTLTVISPPLFSVDLPATKHLALGGKGTAAVTVVGTAPFTYQWFKMDGINPVAIPGATKNVFSWSAVKSTAAGEYYVVAYNKTNGTPNSATSAHMVVDVQAPPAITTQPTTPVSLASGSNLSLSCVASGDPTLTYQWQFNGVNLADGGAIAGSTTNNLTVSPAVWGNAGTYRCIVTNAVGTVTTKNSVVTVISAPIIVTPPAPIYIATGGTGVLKVVAVGTPTLKYQWIKQGFGAIGTPSTSPSLTLSKASLASTQGLYSVSVSNLQSPGVPSAQAMVTVIDAPKIITQPVKVVSSVGKTAHFGIVASGGGTLSYQWQKNNKDIGGQTTSSLDFASVVLTDAATYRCIVKNEVGTVTSSGVTLSVLTAPSITLQPVNVVAYEGSTISFTVAATGSPTLTYQWAKDIGGGTFQPILTTTNSTAKSATLKLTAVKSQDAGNFQVTVTNLAGFVLSNIVTLGTTPPPVPTITDFTPHTAKTSIVYNGQNVAEQILLTGLDLNFVTKVRFSTTTGFTSATFVVHGHNEMVINVPSGANVTAPITLDSPSGSVSTAAVFVPVPASTPVDGQHVPPNDLMINAELLFRPGLGAQGFIGSPNINTTLATTDPLDFYSPSHSVWYHLRPPSSGLYQVSTSGSGFPGYLEVFSGPAIPNTTAGFVLLAHSPNVRVITQLDAETQFTAVAGADYYVSLQGFLAGDFGDVQFTTYKIQAAQKVDADPVEPTTASSELTSAVGGTAGEADSTGIAWLPTSASPANSVVTAKTDLSIDTTVGTPEMFSWSVSDRDGAPVFALTFDAATGHVLSQTAGGSVEETGQVFTPGETYQLSFNVDYSLGVWGASLNGVPILEDQPLSDAAIKSGFGDVAAVWVPAPGATTGGKMHYGNFSVYAAQPVAAK